MLAIQSHWGLQHLPFTEPAQTSPYYPASSHEEALARLHYVIDQQRQACIVEGDVGAGKTFLSRHHARLTQERGFAAAWLNIRGLTDSNLVELLSDRLAVSSPAPNWTRVGHALQEQVLQRQRFLLTLDDADHATPDALEQLRGLFDRFGSGVTIVLTSRAASVGRLHHRFGAISELRVSLEPWTLEEAVEYLDQSLRAVGGHIGMFEAEAIERIHERSEGWPREIGRLARLALLAGAGYHLSAVDALTVDSIAEELL